ncbi:MAG: AraC family transcriptional regulator [Candidatus Azotimanducaceae bacterium]|jgi:AraC family transcriptional regulator
MMNPRIENMPQRLLIGINMEMSLANNRTATLWQTFMLQRGKIKNSVAAEHISMQVYGDHTGALFIPLLTFTKWATAEVSDIPSKMDSYTLTEGLYAVFIHKGPASDFARTMQEIFEQWLPNSEYALDDREHFEILSEGYQPMDTQAQKEV